MLCLVNSRRFSMLEVAVVQFAQVMIKLVHIILHHLGEFKIEQ